MTQPRKALGDSIKAIGNNRIGGYLVRFTDENDRDLHGEWFSKDTEFYIETGYPIKGDRILFEHGFDKVTKVMPIGLFDFVDKRDVGLWVEGKLHDREEYERMLRELRDNGKVKLTDTDIRQKAGIAETAIKTMLEAGTIQWSSGALPQGVLVNEDTHHIDAWPIIEGTVTFSPAEPDGTEVSTLRSAFNQLKALLDFQPNIHPAQAEAQKDGTDRDSAQGDDADNVETGESERILNDNTPTNKDTEMEFSEEQLQALVEKLVPLVASELGVGAPSEEDKQAVTEATQADIEAAAAEAKAEQDDDNDEDEDNKAHRSISSEIVMGWVSAHAVKQLTNKQAVTELAVNGAVSKAVTAHQKKQPATQRPPAYTGDGNGTGEKFIRVTVEEMRAYAGLSGQEMALGIKLALARVPEWDRAHMKLSDFVERGIFSESYLRTMAHKGAAGLEGWKPLPDAASQNDYATMKSISWLKADELHATDITNQGTEWIEFLYDTQLWRRAREETELFNRMASKGMRIQDIPTGVRGMNIKLETASGTVYTLAQGGSTDAGGRPEVVAQLSQITTDEVSQDLATHIIAQGFTWQLMEQSIIDVVSYLNEDMQTALVESIEDVFVNGDTETAASTNINLIDGTPGTGMQTPVYIAFDGIRRNALVTNTGQGTDNAGVALAAVDYERVRAIWPLRIRKLKKNILLMIDDGVETQTRRLAEAFTIGVAGNNATFFSGELSVLVGFDVYASGFLAKTDGDGKLIAAGSGTQGGIWGIYCPYWQYGRQLDINIEEARYPLSQASVFVARISHLLKARSADASVALYDIGV